MKIKDKTSKIRWGNVTFWSFPHVDAQEDGCEKCESSNIFHQVKWSDTLKHTYTVGFAQTIALVNKRWGSKLKIPAISEL